MPTHVQPIELPVVSPSVSASKGWARVLLPSLSDLFFLFIVVLMTATVSMIHFHARPHLFTLLFLTGAIWILEYNRREGGLLIWTLVPLTALWANLHGGFVIFLVLLALRCAGCAAEAW